MLFVVLGLSAGTAVHVYRQWNQPSANPEPILIEIPKGASTGTIGSILQKKELIQSSRSFRWYARLSGLGKQLKAGYFEIPPHSTLKEITDILAGGMEASQRVTIPEGKASWEIFTILKEFYPHLDSVIWEKWVHNPEFAQQLNVPAQSLEGWLFPDTHHLPIQADEKELLTFLVKATQKCLADLETLKAQSTFDQLGGWQQVLTLASIVEEETGKTNERPHIAGVFLNRLRQQIPLGADPTVRFIFRSLTGPIYQSQLASGSPYNTRRFTGLPPGPISNPGKAAIEAVLHPLQTQDLYFVAKDNGSGEHFFSTSLKQHNYYKEVAAKNRKK